MRTITNSAAPHCVEVGDLITITEADTRRTRRLVAWLLRRPHPMRRVMYRCSGALSPNEMGIEPVKEPAPEVRAIHLLTIAITFVIIAIVLLNAVIVLRLLR